MHKPPCSQKQSRTTSGTFLDLALLVYSLGFVFFRLGELIHLVGNYSTQCLATIVALVLSGLITRRGLLSRFLTVSVSIITLIFLMDEYLPYSPPSPSSSLGQSVNNVIITGANSGIGYEMAKTLAVDYGTTVILGCRSSSKCEAAAQQINDQSGSSGGKAIPMAMDLSSFDSVKTFVDNVNIEQEAGRIGKDIDVLFNNAGYAPTPHLSVNEYGLDPSFTSMHLSHHLLTKLLITSRSEDSLKPLRIINTSSGTHHICALPYAVLPKFLLNRFPLMLEHAPGCVDEAFLSLSGGGIQTETDGASYIRAKVANVMHAAEIPRRYGKDKATAVAIDLGWVGTSIMPWMQFSVSPSSIGLMRPVHVGILPVLAAVFQTNEEVFRNLGEKRDWSDGGVVMEAFGTAVEPFSYPWWKTDEAKGIDMCKQRMQKLGEKLWNLTEDILGLAVLVGKS